MLEADGFFFGFFFPNFPKLPIVCMCALKDKLPLGLPATHRQIDSICSLPQRGHHVQLLLLELVKNASQNLQRGESGKYTGSPEVLSDLLMFIAQITFADEA